MDKRAKITIVTKPLTDLDDHPRNMEVRDHPEPGTSRWDVMVESLKHDYFDPLVWNRRNGQLVSGHLRKKIMRHLGFTKADVVEVNYDEPTHIARLLAANKGIGSDNVEGQKTFLRELSGLGLTHLSGFTLTDVKPLLRPLTTEKPTVEQSGSLRRRFMIPPFSVFNAREGWWQDRKRELTSRLGLASGEGREEGLTFANEGEDVTRQRMQTMGTTSVFDPVLCELLYRWFSPVGGVVLDPFAGGSVRGMMAAKLGRQYVGVDLRPEQVQANNQQWHDLPDKTAVGPMVSSREDAMPELTKVERKNGMWFKRDDELCIGGGCGGKVRSCWQLAQGAEGLVTAGSRSSPQVNIVAQIAKRLGIPCRVHLPEGELSPEVLMAVEAGAEVVQHRAGYNNVIIARAREDAATSGWREIPFGMECPEAVAATAAQVANLPTKAKRVVMPVGSGMSLAGVLQGMVATGNVKPVLGIVVGADPTARLDEYAPANWRDMVTLVKAEEDYHQPAPVTKVADISMDPIYEAKCIPHLQPGDCMWIVGLRATETLAEQVAPAPQWIVGDSRDINTLAAGTEADLVFSCPPYADLEVYSNDPNDLSNLAYADFKEAYREIIARTCEQLADNRFAVFVVGEVRGPGGAYYNFVGDTVQAFIDAGLSYYNEAILITPTGSLPLRAGRPFVGSRKLGKTHQNVLVFCKGDPALAAEACGVVDVETGAEETEQGAAE